MVNGKPVAPKLATLEVNLIGVFYSEPQSLPTLCGRSNNSHFDDGPSAVHLGMHYVKCNRAPGAWKAIVMMGSIGTSLGFHAFVIPRNGLATKPMQLPGMASLRRLSMLPQNTVCWV